MKKSFVFLLHLGYWLIYSSLLFVIISIVHLQFNQTPVFPTLLFYFSVGVLCVFPNVFAFYIFYFLLFPKFLRRKKIFALIVGGVLTAFISALLGGLALFALVWSDKPIFAELNEFFGLVVWLFSVAAIHGGIALVLKGFIKWFDEVKLNEELNKKNYQTELALIKSQINPHFLFNTINNIDVLITKDAAKASDYLNKLSDILRYLVYETKIENIALITELTYIEKYLELQKIRTANPNYVNYKVRGDAGNLMIAPMLFFPFIENAFKHAENKKISNAINIKISIENEKKQLVFECENTRRSKARIEPDFGGLGNELIKRRLALLYPGRHRLEIVNHEQTYSVTMSLDLYEN